MASRLKTNIALNFAYQLLILALPLVTAPYLSRVIGAEGVGVYSYSYSVALYFTYFVKLGLDNYGNREIAGCGDDRALRSERFWSIYAMQALSFAAVGIAYIAYVALVAEDAFIAALQGIFVLSSLFDINWFFFGIERFKVTVVRNTVVKLATTACIFLFVKDGGDIATYVAVMCTGFLATQLCIWPFVGRYVDFCRPSLKGVRAHIKPNLVLFLPVVAVSVYGVLSKIILGAMAGSVEVGFYESAYKIIQVPVALVTAVGTVMLPRTSALVAQGRDGEADRYIERTLVAVCAFTCLCAFGIPEIAGDFTLLFYGQGFEPAAQAMAVLSATVPLLGFGNVIRSQYLIPRGFDSVFLVSAFCGAGANLLVNIALIPRLGALGAAWGSVAAELAVLAYQLFMVRSRIPLGRYLGYAGCFLVAGACMAAVLGVVPLGGGAPLRMALAVGVGAVVYGAVGIAGLYVLHRSFGKRRL